MLRPRPSDEAAALGQGRGSPTKTAAFGEVRHQRHGECTPRSRAAGPPSLVVMLTSAAGLAARCWSGSRRCSRAVFGSSSKARAVPVSVLRQCICFWCVNFEHRTWHGGSAGGGSAADAAPVGGGGGDGSATAGPSARQRRQGRRGRGCSGSRHERGDLARLRSFSRAASVAGPGRRPRRLLLCGGDGGASTASQSGGGFGGGVSSGFGYGGSGVEQSSVVRGAFMFWACRPGGRSACPRSLSSSPTPPSSALCAACRGAATRSCHT